MHEETDRIPLSRNGSLLPRGSRRPGSRPDDEGYDREVLEADLVSYDIDVERVAVNKVMDEAPRIRTKGDVTIVPVLEERVVIEKRLVLVEEIRIRRRSTFRPERVEADPRSTHQVGAAMFGHGDVCDGGRRLTDRADLP